MEKTHLDIWAEKIFKETGFKPEKEIKRGYYYTEDKIRSLVFSGQYQNKPAVLKIYDDPRLTDEPLALQSFNETNESEILKAPKLYAHELISPKKGWLIMEQLPENSRPFQRPLKPAERPLFLELFLEYRRNFPKEPHRSLTLLENLPDHLFHIFRINRWFQLANDKEAELMAAGEKPVLDPKNFLPLYQKALEKISQEFSHRKMIWSHGHFNPAEVFKHPNKNAYYLTDFMHTKMYPEGYELGLIIWSDWIMNAWQISYAKWRKGIDQWLNQMGKVAEELKINEFFPLIQVSLIERCLGTILADICATDRPQQEKMKHLALVYKFLNELLDY